MLWLHRLCGIHIAERAFPLVLRGVCLIDHVHVLHVGQVLLLHAMVFPAGATSFSVIIIMRIGLPYVDITSLGDLSKDPAIPVCIGGWSIRCPGVYGAWLAKDYI